VYLTTLTLLLESHLMLLQEKVQVLNSADGASSGAGQSAWDFALTGNGDALGVDGLSMGSWLWFSRSWISNQTKLV
jgi:hypothetical protein